MNFGMGKKMLPSIKQIEFEKGNEKKKYFIVKNSKLKEEII